MRKHTTVMLDDIWPTERIHATRKTLGLRSISDQEAINMLARYSSHISDEFQRILREIILTDEVRQ